MSNKSKILTAALFILLCLMCIIVIFIVVKRKEIKKSFEKSKKRSNLRDYLYACEDRYPEFRKMTKKEQRKFVNEYIKKEEDKKIGSIAIKNILRNMKDDIGKKFSISPTSTIELKFYILRNDDCTTRDTDFTIHLGLGLSPLNSRIFKAYLYSDLLTNMNASRIRTENNFYGESHTRDNDESIQWNPGNNILNPNNAVISDHTIEILQYFQKKVLDKYKIGFYNSEKNKDNIVDYDAGMPTMTISNKNPKISRILRDRIEMHNDYGIFIKMAQNVKIAQLDQNGKEIKNNYGEIQYESQGEKTIELLEVTDAIIQIFSILCYERENNPPVKFEFRNYSPTFSFHNEYYIINID